MILRFLSKLLLTAIILFLLSVISFNILLRDPLNHFNEFSAIDAYLYYVNDLLHGNLGISYSNGEALIQQILTVFPATISLCIVALIVALIIGIPLGFIAALSAETLIGKILKILGSLSLAVPVFWLALLLLYYASINQWQILAVGELNPIYQITPITGFKIIDIALSNSPYKLKMMQSLLHHLAMPALILAIPATLEIMQATRLRTQYVLKQNYIKVAQTRGGSPLKIWCIHVLRNTLPALIPSLTRTIILIFAFAMLIENIFSWGGIGRWLINALSIEDYNAISAGIVAISIFILLVDIIASLITTLLDPSQKKDWYDHRT